MRRGEAGRQKERKEERKMEGGGKKEGWREEGRGKKKRHEKKKDPLGRSKSRDLVRCSAGGKGWRKIPGRRRSP